MTDVRSDESKCSEDTTLSPSGSSVKSGGIPVRRFIDDAGYFRELMNCPPAACLVSIAMAFTLSCMQCFCQAKLSSAEARNSDEPSAFEPLDPALLLFELNWETVDASDKLLISTETLPESQFVTKPDRSHFSCTTHCVFAQNRSAEREKISSAGFRVAPKPIELLPVETQSHLNLNESGLFPIRITRLTGTEIVAQTMEFSMLYSTVYWGRIRVEGTPASTKVPDEILRKMWAGKAKLPRSDLTKFLATVIPEATVNLPRGDVVLTPAALEKSMLPPDLDIEPFAENTVLLRFEEICLPDRRRHGSSPYPSDCFPGHRLEAQHKA